ncbi:MAG: MaoC family dehydratase [Leucobacter sp.]|jgi:acyl dehydratase|nr:MaoC family dehydratase [Leucobacter sp.]
MREFESADEILASVGEEVGVSSWIEVTQERVSTFADATDDWQWIHLDAERAAEGPFGGTIAHGFLTLSMLVPMMAQVYSAPSSKMSLNYGLNKVRFTSPVPVGSRIRGRFVLAAVDEVEGGLQLTWAATVEREDSDRPACIAEFIARIYF